jgi:hypothetical protein
MQDAVPNPSPSFNPTRFVPDRTEDRQWDCRFNVQSDDDVDSLLASIKSYADGGALSYILIGGTEIGDNQYQDDFGIRHVHVAAIFVNRISKSAILKNFNIKRGNGYYLVPRNRNLPYTGWKNHHTKLATKTDPKSRCLFELGDLPADKKEAVSFVKRSEEEKKRKVDDILIDIRELIEQGDEKRAFTTYPRTFLQYGEKLKALVIQKKDKLKSEGHPHIWLYGAPGVGKSAILAYIYPNYFKKNLYNKFFDLYDDTIHTHVMLEDLDHDAVDRLSTNFLKTLCDESGFAIDQKYKTPQLTRSSILVTSNFTINQIISESDEANVFGKEANKTALLRRFWHINAVEFMRMLGLKIIPKYEIQMLKKQGNLLPGKLFMTWDYLTDSPVGESIKTPEVYQQIVKDQYYSS